MLLLNIPEPHLADEVISQILFFIPLKTQVNTKLRYFRNSLSNTLYF